MLNPSPRVYIAAAVIVALGTILGALVGRSSGVSTGQQQGQQEAFATAAVQQATTVAQGAVTQITETRIAITQVAITQVSVTQIIGTSQPIVVTATPEPTVPLVGDTPPGTILTVEQTWKSNGIELTLVSREFIVGQMLLQWRLKNNTVQELSVKYDSGNFSAKDNLGNPLSIYGFRDAGEICFPVNRILQPGESIMNSYCKQPLTIGVDLNNKQITEIIVTATDISRIERAQWKIPINIR